ncbi:hypothetical protein [Pantoea sp.]|uniref:hypothetical protein n=1 Tax=Pantoea sp. TaxID=69393 RepID=UPI0031DEFD11
MYRSDEERLTDIIMGDAVIQLLKKRGPVSARALMDKLRTMALVEHDPLRQNALRRAMVEVTQSMGIAENSGVPIKDHNNVTHIFRNRDGADKGAKH